MSGGPSKLTNPRWRCGWYEHSHSHASVLCPLSSIAWSSARFRGLAILAVCGSRRGIAEIRPALPPHHQPENNCHKNCVQKRRPASRIKKAHARQIAARTVEAGDESELDRVTTVGKDDRRRRSRRLGRERRDRAAGRKDSRPPVDEPNRPLVPAAIVLTVRPAVFDRYVLALDVAVFTKASAKRSHVRRDAVER